MQIMPFWAKLIGDKNRNHYRALGRQNGSLGAPEYPNLVRGAWEKLWYWGEHVVQAPR